MSSLPTKATFASRSFGLFIFNFSNEIGEGSISIPDHWFLLSDKVLL